MRKIRLISILSVIFLSSVCLSAQEITSYYSLGSVEGSINDISKKVTAALTEKGFKIFGSYYPQGKYSNKVIAFTRDDLYKVALSGKDQKFLAAMLKVGLIKDGEKVKISLLNPEYIFNAYFRGSFATYKDKLMKVDSDAKEALKSIGGEFTAFGGGLSAKELQKYHYMMGMPYFDEPIELKIFSSFEEGTKIIEENLNSKKSSTEKVYMLKFSNSKIALYGIALNDKEKGEAAFLPKIGTDHIAAMPYELLLIDNKAIMLHAKYRLALHWPKLTMAQFMKISSTPGKIEDILKSLTE
ncbi:MAG: hypothetical protein JXR51_04230 [Bacteroidales bacterium]|nr:hypothetical protein [Bacteroidales bacterium]MBN2756364.1 hypothetical protein [Bacteroidales bacterium]